MYMHIYTLIRTHTLAFQVSLLVLMKLETATYYQEYAYMYELKYIYIYILLFICLQ